MKLHRVELQPEDNQDIRDRYWQSFHIYFKVLFIICSSSLTGEITDVEEIALDLKLDLFPSLL